MFKIHFLFVLLISCLCSKAEIPPVEVQQAFAQKFPTAKAIHWGKEGSKVWEAEFEQDGIKLTAEFNLQGIWQETEQKVDANTFPVAVTDAIRKQNPGWKILETSRTETLRHGLIFEVTLSKGKQKKEQAYHENGTKVAE